MIHQNYLHSIDIVLGIITNNLEVIQSLWGDVGRLYAKTLPSYIRDLNILGFCYPQGAWKPIPQGYGQMTVFFSPAVSHELFSFPSPTVFSLFFLLLPPQGHFLPDSGRLERRRIKGR